MITRIAALMLLGALSFRVGAEEPVNLVYKCVNKAGTQYQSQPCAKGETVHIRLADPAPVSPEAAAANQRYLDDLRQQNAASRPTPQPAPAAPVYRNGGGGARLHNISQYKDRKPAKPPRPSESVFSACTAPIGLTWLVVAWMTWCGLPASSPWPPLPGCRGSAPTEAPHTRWRGIGPGIGRSAAGGSASGPAITTADRCLRRLTTSRRLTTLAG